MEVPVNYLAILVAGVASMVIGFLWYSPMILGNQWMREKGYTSESLKKAQKEMGKLYGISFILSLITAYVLSHVMVFAQSYLDYSIQQTGLTSGFFMWLGFIMPVQVTATIFGDKKLKLLGIDTGFQLASILVMGFVLGLL